MYNNQPTKFQIKIHNGSSIKKNRNTRKSLFYDFPLRSFFMFLFFSLSYSLTHSLHCFILHIIFPLFFFSYFPRQKIDILKTFILSSTFSLFCTNEKWNLFFYTRTHPHTHTDFFYIWDDFNSNYMDILIIYLCIFH